MEVAMEVEDDVFFADLNKQISLLIMDDDDGDDPVAHCPSVSLQGFSRAVYPAAQAQAQPPPPPFSYQQTCRRESKGTGVFIPQSSSHPRRKNRQGKNSSSNNTKFQRHSDNSSGPPHASFMNIPSQNSINPKRC